MFIYVERFTLGHLHNEIKILLNKAALVIQTLVKKGRGNDMRRAEVNSYVKPFWQQRRNCIHLRCNLTH